MDLGFNLAQSNQDLKDPTSRQIFGDTSGLLCKNDLIPCLKLLHDFPLFSSIYCDRQLCRGAIWKYIFDIWSRLRLYCFPSTPIFGPTEKTEIVLMGVIILILILEPTMMTFSQW